MTQPRYAVAGDSHSVRALTDAVNYLTQKGFAYTGRVLNADLVLCGECCGDIVMRAREANPELVVVRADDLGTFTSSKAYLLAVGRICDSKTYEQVNQVQGALLAPYARLLGALHQVVQHKAQFKTEDYGSW